VSSKVDCWVCGKRASAVFLVANRNVAVCQYHDPRQRNPGEDWLYMWEIAPDEETLREMRYYGCKFAAYQIVDPLYEEVGQVKQYEERGELKFLRYGYLNNLYATPPEFFPTRDGAGAGSYKLIGYVNLETGTIHSKEQDARVEGDPYGSGEDERLLPPSCSARLWVR
jgi:hypothetical protein